MWKKLGHVEDELHMEVQGMDGSHDVERIDHEALEYCQSAAKNVQLKLGKQSLVRTPYQAGEESLESCPWSM